MRRADRQGACLVRESEFDLPGVGKANPDISRLLLEIGYDHLTFRGHVELTNEALASIIRAKQRAVIAGADFFLA